MRRGVVIGASMLALLAAAGWCADYLLWRNRVSAGRNAYADYVVTTYYVIPQKNNRMELIFGGRAPERCVNALAPHAGYKPCWYLARNTEQRIEQ